MTDFEWAWSVLCEGFRPDPPANAVPTEPVPADAPAEQPDTLDGDRDDDDR
jgi:hypothetical protein